MKLFYILLGIYTAEFCWFLWWFRWMSMFI